MLNFIGEVTEQTWEIIIPSHLKADWHRFALNEELMASRSPSGDWLVIYEPSKDHVVVVLSGDEVAKLQPLPAGFKEVHADRR